jgi:hypothetical protein
MVGSSISERAKVLGAVASATLSSHSPLANAIAEDLAGVVDDRAYLRQLDHQVALLVAASLTGDASPRALRRYPPRRLRREAGLGSLVVARNHKRGSA